MVMRLLDLEDLQAFQEGVTTISFFAWTLIQVAIKLVAGGAQ